MRAQAHSFAKRSTAKKVVACTVAAALVASMSYFHLWSAPQAIAEGPTVEVSFKLSDDVVVVANGLEYDSRSTDTCAASVEEDFTFVAKTTQEGREIGSLTADMPGLNVETEAELPDTGESTESVDDDGENSFQQVATPTDGVVTLEQEVEPIAETAAIFEAQNNETAVVDEQETEVLEDEATPMAAGVSSESTLAEDESATVAQVTYDPETGECVIAKEDLARAADAGTAIVVSISSQAMGAPADDWDALKGLLSQDEPASIKLSGDLEASDPIVVKGQKTLDLNGFTITSNLKGGSLFTVSADASFTIDDTTSKYRDLETVGKGEKIDRPSTDPDAFQDKIGRAAEVDGDTITYYVARSYIDGSNTGMTDEYQIPHQVNMEGVGTVRVQSEQNLIYLEAGAQMTLAAGRFGLAEGVKADIHAIEMNRGGSFTMTGGFITNFYTIGSGAAISANNKAEKLVQSTIAIGGNAVIAGNQAVKNGGAVWLSSESKDVPVEFTIGGSAVIAGNIAGVEKSEQDKGTIAVTKNGGGVYARRNCNVRLEESAIVSGNTAHADGGGIYIEGRIDSANTKNTLSISGNAVVTNNRSENDRSAFHPTDRSAENHPAGGSGDFWRNYGGGGGGIFTLDETTINGGQITGNYASDGGGGIHAIGGLNMKGAYGASGTGTLLFPLIKIENGIVASNYAGTSEGGGINVSSLKDSYIKAGYITNNMTATYYDYGGGGLFLTSATQGKSTGPGKTASGMTLYAPLVKNNEAAGLGGGVASCTNGVVVSANAAVYDNKAQAENTTQNPNEYGDQWVLEGNLHKDDLEEGQDTYGLVGTDVENYAKDSDFYCAKESKVHNQMLGGGFYNWEGYTTGSVEMESVYAERKDYESKKKFLRINNETEIIVKNVFYRSKYNVMTIIVSQELAHDIESLVGYKMTFETRDVTTSQEGVKGKGLVKAVGRPLEMVNDGVNDTCDPGDAIIYLQLGELGNREAAPTNIKLKKAHTRTEITPTDYPMYKVNPLGETNTFVDSKRLTVLKANPNDEAKAAAESIAKLFLTGNYSNTHGGGIACNDYVDIGGTEIPDVTPPTELGALKVTKTLNKFNAESGSATAVFEVTGYTDYEAYKAGIEDKVIYRNTIGFSFGGSDQSQTAERVLEDLTEGYYVVKELFYSGDNFREDEGRNVKTVVVKAGTTAETAKTVSFTNTYKDETYGTGVVNNYDKNGGTYTYTPDANYQKRHDELSTEEGR